MLLLLACARGSLGTPPFDDASVAVEVSEKVDTVATVTWQDEGGDDVYVEFGPDTDYGHRAEGADGTARLFGMPADATWHFRLVAEVDGETYAGEDHTVTTGRLPSGVPDTHVVTEGDPGSYILTSWLASPSEGTAVMVLDKDANVVWYQVPDWGVAMASKVSTDGQSIVTLLSSHDEIGDARIVRVSPEGELLDEVAVPYAHHDFLEVPFAKYAVIAGEIRDVDGQAVLGDGIVEVADDGSERVVWSAFDHFPVEENEGFSWMAYPVAADWTHANSLVYDEATDTYALSLYMQRCIVRVARATGEQLWSMCADGTGDIASDGWYGPQHSLELTDDGIRFFDNAYESDDGASRISRFVIDGDVMHRVETWEHPDRLRSVVLGDVQAMDDGRMLSSWGEWREIVVSDGDEIDWRVQIVDAASVAQVETFGGF